MIDFIRLEAASRGKTSKSSEQGLNVVKIRKTLLELGYSKEKTKGKRKSLQKLIIEYFEQHPDKIPERQSKKEQKTTVNKEEIKIDFKYFYGQIDCQSTVKSTQKPCQNKSYYFYQDQYVCGVHSKKDHRIKLLKNPNEKKEKELILKQQQTLVEERMKENKSKNKKGTVVCSKLRMMRAPPHLDGFLKIFPNFKHQNRQDGFGCMSLSPKAMGPIEHNQRNLPIALNLENFHQGNKVFASELDENGQIKSEFFETQKRMYQDPVPHRHKKEAKGKGQQKNVPVFSVWTDENGQVQMVDYFTSRQFYCGFYQRITECSEDFKKLQEMLAEGYDLQIIGYDGYSVNQSVEECYKDVSRPFGHELVLYTMLTHSEEDYPWLKYKTFQF